MSNIYEALQQAQTDRRPECPSGRGVENEQAPLLKSEHRGEADFAADAEMLNLYLNIDYLLPDCPNKIIQFMGSTDGEGVSTIVRRFAQTAISKFGKKVLIVDAAHHNPTQHIHFKINCAHGGKEAMVNGEPAHEACYPAGVANLYLSPLAAQASLIPQIHNREASKSAFDQLREIFDLVLIDSSPGTTSADSIAISRYSDGVIMVIEAEKTSWQMAESVKEKIYRSDGNILGIIFNRRRFHSGIHLQAFVMVAKSRSMADGKNF